MANRQFTQFQYSLEKKIVNLYAEVAVGTSGAPTLDAAGSKGVFSIARNSAGKYTITFQDPYYALLMVQPMIILASGSPAVAQMIVESADTQVAKQVVVKFLDETLAAADIASGATLMLKFEFKDSSV